ncbi:hypothetical protein Pcinc_007191 [Petrolisthes cinctipes]|uniref:Uncharacterized protein n=1 Tax=Petrolisthes cinctipes TaxID=88211 RepID=A0AAE1KXM6_PETCI|nr:hypothetical protein Pcinc_007191 [Petrolisthes cinctipes]
MVVSRSPAASPAVEGKVKFGSVTLPLQDHVKILGVTFDAELRFDKHIHHIAHQASLRVSALRRVAGFLDNRGLMTLYKAQLRINEPLTTEHLQGAFLLHGIGILSALFILLLERLLA